MADREIFVPSARDIFLGDTTDTQREAEFYSSISLPNGVTKRTSHGRLRELDTWLLSHLDFAKRVDVLDLGISAGVTTVELAEALRANNFDFQITGVDLYIDAFLVLANPRESVLLDRDGNPIHYELAGRGIGHGLGRNLMRRMQIWGLKRFAANLWRRYRPQFAALKDPEKIGGFMAHPVRLLCRAIAEDPNITVIEADVFAGNFSGEYDLIRAANLLNLAYFSEDKIRIALTSIKAVLKPGGLFLAARTDENNVTGATLFRLNEVANFEVDDRFGAGSELERLL